MVQKAFRPGTQKSASYREMRHLYEMWLSADGDWGQSSLMVNLKNKKGTSKKGVHVWKKFCTLVAECLACH